MHDARILMIPVLAPMVHAAVVPHDHVMLCPFVRVPKMALGDVLLQKSNQLFVLIGIVYSDDLNGEGRYPQRLAARNGMSPHHWMNHIGLERPHPMLFDVFD